MGILLTSGPAKGIWAFQKDWLLSNLKILHPFQRNPLVLMDATWYQAYVTNHLTLEETEAFMAEECSSSSRLVAQTIGKYGEIDFSQPHAPLLFIAGAWDRSQPLIIQEKNAKAYTHSDSQTDYIVLEGRTHALHLQKRWEEIAKDIEQWIASQ